jgi:hypothetical protein
MMWRAHGMTSPAISSDIVTEGARSRAEERGEPNSALGVQQSGALRQRRVAGELLRGVLQNGLDRIRRQRGIRLEHQATVPLTTGAAMLVPLMLRYGL